MATGLVKIFTNKLDEDPLPACDFSSGKTLDQGCATFLVVGPYNKTSDIKRVTLKI